MAMFILFFIRGQYPEHLSLKIPKGYSDVVNRRQTDQVIQLTEENKDKRTTNNLKNNNNIYIGN